MSDPVGIGGHLAKDAFEEVSPIKLTMTKFECLLFPTVGHAGPGMFLVHVISKMSFAKEGTWCLLVSSKPSALAAECNSWSWSPVLVDRGRGRAERITAGRDAS